jgi:endonuclease YncB( thermonuclease family)
VTVDRYARSVAFVRIGYTVIEEELILQGLARVFSRYCNRALSQEWQALEAEARERKRGLWSMPNALPPSPSNASAMPSHLRTKTPPKAYPRDL